MKKRRRKISKAKQVFIVILQVMALTLLICTAFYVYGKLNKKTEEKAVEIPQEPKADENGIVWDEKMEQIVKWSELPVQKDEKNSVKDIVNSKYTICSINDGQTADGTNYLKIGFADETNRYAAVFEVSAEQDCLSLFEYYVGDEKVTDITQIDELKTFLESYEKENNDNVKSESEEKKEEKKEEKQKVENSKKSNFNEEFVLKNSKMYFAAATDACRAINITPISNDQVRINVDVDTRTMDCIGEIVAPFSVEFKMETGDKVKIVWKDEENINISGPNGFSNDTINHLYDLYVAFDDQYYTTNTP